MGRSGGGSREKRRAPLRLSLRRAPRLVPTHKQASYLRQALDQPGLTLPLFDAEGRPVETRLVDACVVGGWAERWFDDPRLPGRICRLTDRGVQAAMAADRS